MLLGSLMHLAESIGKLAQSLQPRSDRIVAANCGDSTNIPVAARQHPDSVDLAPTAPDITTLMGLGFPGGVRLSRMMLGRT